MKRNSLKSFLNVEDAPNSVSFEIIRKHQEDGYIRQLISYRSPDGDEIRAFLFLPDREWTSSAVLLHHQHNSGRQIGKSEIAGLKGDKYQAFGPALARRGIVGLAPDSICFEDRRRLGYISDTDDEPGAYQHFLEMSYRLVKGDTLMRKILADAALGISILRELPQIDKVRVGVAGHSMGGNTALFQAATDERVAFVCSSGALASYKSKIQAQTGLEMALLIPGFVERFDTLDVVKQIAPRPLLILSATEDCYTVDAEEIVKLAQPSFPKNAELSNLEHHHFQGAHDLDLTRFNMMVEWITKF